MSAAVIIPMRGFRGAKGRLSDALDGSAREALAQVLLSAVMEGAGPLDIIVVTSDPAVIGVATAGGASVVDDPGELDSAVTAGVSAARAMGYDRAVVGHGDLPFAAGLADLGATDLGATDLGPVDSIVLVPDRRRDGTNVISLPVSIDFRFQYGPGSFDRHLAEARRLGIEPTVLTETRLSWDVDIPEDLDTPTEWGPPPWERNV